MSINSNYISNFKSLFHFYKNGEKLVSNTLLEEMKLDLVRKILNLSDFELFQNSGIYIPISDEHNYSLKEISDDK